MVNVLTLLTLSSTTAYEHRFLSRSTNIRHFAHFRTTAGFLEGGDARAVAGLPGRGPRAVITDLGVLGPEPESRELVLSALFDGVTVEKAREACGWPLRTAAHVEAIAPPTAAELATLRDLQARTREAHAHRVRIRLPD